MDLPPDRRERSGGGGGGEFGLSSGEAFVGGMRCEVDWIWRGKGKEKGAAFKGGGGGRVCAGSENIFSPRHRSGSSPPIGRGARDGATASLLYAARTLARGRCVLSGAVWVHVGPRCHWLYGWDSGFFLRPRGGGGVRAVCFHPVLLGGVVLVFLGSFTDVGGYSPRGPRVIGWGATLCLSQTFYYYDEY